MWVNDVCNSLQAMVIMQSCSCAWYGTDQLWAVLSTEDKKMPDNFSQLIHRWGTAYTWVYICR